MGRSPCCERVHANKGAWSEEEDQRLVNYIRAHGEGFWRSLPKAAGLLRCGKSCRLRWINYLRPDLKRGNFTEEEDDIIIKLHSLLGNKWSLIARRLPGRTDNEIKNYWNTRIKRRLIKHGIDPQSHRPLNSSSSSAAATSALYKYKPTNNIINSRRMPTTEDAKLHDYSSSSRDDGSSRCNSTTTDESTPPPPPSNSGEALDLDLSIGLPSFSNYQKISLVTFASEYN